MSVTFLTNNDRDELEAKIAEGGGAVSGEETISLIKTSVLGTAITSSKPEVNLYELGKELLNRNVVLVEDEYYVYRCSCLLTTSSSGSNPYNSFIFICISNDIRQYIVRFYKNGDIDSYSANSNITYIPNIPQPSLSTGQIKYLIATAKGYELADPPVVDNGGSDESSSSYTLVAVNTGDGLMAFKTFNLFETMSSMMSALNIVPVLLAVASDMDLTEVSLYTCSKVFNATDPTNIYAIFTNGIETAIKMDAEGNFTYVYPE